MKYLILSLVLSMVASAETATDAVKIKVGMSKPQVIQALGEPANARTRGTGVTFTYRGEMCEHPKVNCEIAFEDGKATAVTGFNSKHVQ